MFKLRSSDLGFIPVFFFFFFSQTHQQNSYNTAKNKQQKTLAFMWIQIKQSKYVLNKKEPSMW